MLLFVKKKKRQYSSKCMSSYTYSFLLDPLLIQQHSWSPTVIKGIGFLVL